LINQFIFSLFLESDDDERNKNVDEEEWEDNEVDYVEDGHLHPVARQWTLIAMSGINRMS